MNNLDKILNIINISESKDIQLCKLMQIFHKNNYDMSCAYIIYTYINRYNNEFYLNLDKNIQTKKDCENILKLIKNNNSIFKSEQKSVQEKLKLISKKIDIGTAIKDSNFENVGVCSHCNGTEKEWNEGYYEDRGYYSTCSYCESGWKSKKDFISIKNILKTIESLKDVSLYSIGNKIDYKYDYGYKNKNSSILEVMENLDMYDKVPVFKMKNGDVIKITAIL